MDIELYLLEKSLKATLKWNGTHSSQPRDISQYLQLQLNVCVCQLKYAGMSKDFIKCIHRIVQNYLIFKNQ